MAPPSLWSGNLRLSLVIIPVRLIPAVSTEEAISFRQIHEPSGTPIRYVKGVHDGDTFTEVPDEEIVKGYEYAKGQHVLIDPKEIDFLSCSLAGPRCSCRSDSIYVFSGTQLPVVESYRYPGALVSASLVVSMTK